MLRFLQTPKQVSRSSKQDLTTLQPAMLYFDHNATHPMSRVAREAWLTTVEQFPANPSSPHRLGQRADRALEDARERLGRSLGLDPATIVFTSGATEASNSVLASFPRVWVSATEHPCVTEPAREKGVQIPVNAQGVVEVAWIEERLCRGEHPELVCVMAANNETGVVQPVKEVANLCREHGLPWMCDAVQWIGKMPSTDLPPATFLIASAHKFGGPPGIGFLASGQPIPALLRGGPQEHGRRAGTENLPAILAMVAALEERAAAIERDAIAERRAWKTAFETKAKEAIPGILVLGEGAPRLWNTVSVLMPELADCRRRWVVVMDKLGFAVSTGSACSSGKEKPSPVLTAMGIGPSDAGRALRFSSGWDTTEGDWNALLEGLTRATAEMATR